MKRFFLLNFFLLTYVFLLPAIVFSQEVKNALLIANGEYGNEIPSLNEPIPEARNLKIALESIGFNVTIVENANREDMYNALRAFKEKCEKEEGIAFFHYGGHAVQISGINYLVPSNSRLGTIKEVPYNCVSVDDVMDHMTGDANIVILDSCRNNPFKSGTRGSTRGLAAVTRKPANSIIVYSADVDEVAFDGVFTPILTQYITEKNISLEDVLKKVRTDVLKKTNDKQECLYSSRLKWSIYLADDVNANVVRQTLKGFLEISTYTPCTVYVDITNMGEIKGFSSERFDIRSGVHRIKVKYQDGNIETSDVVINSEACEKWRLTYISKEQLEIFVDLGGQYLFGKGGKKRNLKEAFKYYKMVADKGDSRGEFGVGSCFEAGLEIEQNGSLENEKRALEWYRKASAKGHGGAIFKLGVFYHHGKGGIKEDYNEAIRLYKKAIETKFSDEVVKKAQEKLDKLKPLTVSQTFTVSQERKVDKKEEEKKVERKVGESVKKEYIPPFYSLRFNIAYNISHFTTKNDFVKFNAHGIKFGLTFCQFRDNSFVFLLKSSYSFCRSEKKFVSETIDYHDFSFFEIQIGGTFEWWAFHFTILQPSCHIRSIVHNSKNGKIENDIDTKDGGYWGFRFGADFELRVHERFSFYFEYNTPKISLTEKMDDSYFMQHSMNFGINISIFNAYN